MENIKDIALEMKTKTDLLKLRARKGQSVKDSSISMVLNRWKTNRKIEQVAEATWRKV